MCILATASAGAIFPRETLERMFKVNPDGAGWAYAKDGKIYYAKGYSKVNKFVKAIEKLPADVERMVHCRIATHGGVCPALTHPFPVCKSYERMEALTGVMSHGYILAHNGILTNFRPEKNHSDTEELARCLASVGGDIMREELRGMINALVDGSRVAILNTDGKINRYGTGWVEENGIWYSNGTYKPYAYTYGYNYGYYGDWYDDGDYYSAYEEREKLPALGDLDLLEEGAVCVNETNNRAFLNATSGSYLVDKKTGNLYGQYKGAIHSTPYKECRRANCVGCDIDCPLMK